MNRLHILLYAFFIMASVYFLSENAKAGFSSDCALCHEKLGRFTSPHTEEDCKTCHAWSERHVVPGICARCHPANIHETHKEEVLCNLCHNPPANFNSSRVKLPYAGGSDPEGLIIPESKECTYCHTINAGGGSLHEIHRSNLPNICSKCHHNEMDGQSMENIEKALATNRASPGRNQMTPIQDFSRLFNEIAVVISSIF